jgi:hypothetical protein
MKIPILSDLLSPRSGFIDSLFPQVRFMAINEAAAKVCSAVADRCFSYALATNIAPMPKEGDWLPMPEYGDVDYWTMEDGNPKKYVQRFTQDQARKMKLRLQAKSVQEGSDFRGLPIFVGHPPADAAKWPDERRLGHVLEIDDNPQRARVRVALNDRGRKNREEGYWVYPSPGWDYSGPEARRTGIILPDELHHIGMTNMPRMASAKPWTNVDDTAAAASSSQPAAANQTKEKNTMPKWLIEKLIALNVLSKPADGVEPTEAELQAAVGRLAVNVDPMEIALGQKKISVVIAGDNRETFLSELATNTAALQTAQTTATNAEAESKKFRKLAINAHLDRAVDKGILTAAERPQWATDFEGDFDGTLTKLTAKRTALNTRELDPLRPVNGHDLSTPRGRQLAFNVRVDELVAEGRKNNPQFSIDDAINKMRGNAADAALLKAMEPAATT